MELDTRLPPSTGQLLLGHPALRLAVALLYAIDRGHPVLASTPLTPRDSRGARDKNRRAPSRSFFETKMKPTEADQTSRVKNDEQGVPQVVAGAGR